MPPPGGAKKVEKLVKLGFEMGAVLEALSQCGDDAKKATLFLVEKEKQAKKMKKQQAKAAAENAKPAEAAATPAPKPKAEAAAAAEASPSSPEVPAASGNKPEPEDLENPKKSKAAPKEQKNPPAKKDAKEKKGSNKEKKEKKDAKEKKGSKDKKDKATRASHEQNEKANTGQQQPPTKKPRTAEEAPHTPPPRPSDGSPLGCDKQPPAKVELRTLNPTSMAKFFDSETYAKTEHKQEPHESTSMDRRDTEVIPVTSPTEPLEAASPMPSDTTTSSPPAGVNAQRANTSQPPAAPAHRVNGKTREA